ncbi:hypothetical protein ACFSQP_09370 [Bizionia sediminis]|uniref:NirD/YgiW/YdeI family stress tolerance protein n=1 Tax=Bizionia sediminis TaxID=1737064 RepID=A0ABW5KU93_9FLAO
MKTLYNSILCFALLLVGSLASAQTNDSNKTAENLEITPITNLKNNTSAYIKGQVEKILDNDTFRIKDNSGSIAVYTGWKNTNLVTVGQQVIVKGVLDSGLFKEFYASEIKINKEPFKTLTPD